MKLPVNYENLDWRQRREVRELYVHQQKGLCWYCHNSMKRNPAKEVLSKKVNQQLFPSTFFEHPVHLHHDHQTGMTIGAVHAYCNAVLWQYHGE